MPCWHVGPHGPGCDGYVEPANRFIVTPPDFHSADWESIAKQLEARLQISMEQTRVAQETARAAQAACEEALMALRDHLKICPSH